MSKKKRFLYLQFSPLHAVLRSPESYCILYLSVPKFVTVSLTPCICKMELQGRGEVPVPFKKLGKAGRPLLPLGFHFGFFLPLGSTYNSRNLSRCISQSKIFRVNFATPVCSHGIVPGGVEQPHSVWSPQCASSTWLKREGPESVLP